MVINRVTRDRINALIRDYREVATRHPGALNVASLELHGCSLCLWLV